MWPVFKEFSTGPLRISLLVLLASASIASAAQLLNVTIDHAHPSIFYYPTSSWRVNDPIDPQKIYCSRRRYATPSLTPAGIGPGKTGKPELFRTSGTTTLSRELADWQSQIWPSNHPRRVGGECDASDIGPQGHFDISRWPITFRFKFIGTAVYVYGFATPLPQPDLTLTLGVVFAVDDKQVQVLGGCLGYLPLCSMDEPIFSDTSLADDREHELVVVISPSWKFFLHSIIFTTPNPDRASRYAPPSLPSPAQPSDGPQRVLKPRTEEATSNIDQPKKHHIVTFVAAVTTVVGVLAIVSLAVIFSLIRRRRRARQRDNAEEQTSTAPGDVPRIRARRISSSTLGSSSTVFHTEASEDVPNPDLNLRAIIDANMGGRDGGTAQMMEGPAPFVPRFFPGATVLLSSADSRNRPLSSAPPVVGRSIVDIGDQDDALPPPYDFAEEGNPNPILSHSPDMLLLTPQFSTRTDALHSLHSPEFMNQRHFAIVGGDGAEEQVRNYTYADIPPSSTPPPLPSHPSSPPPQQSMPSSSNIQSYFPNAAPNPPQLSCSRNSDSPELGSSALPPSSMPHSPPISRSESPPPPLPHCPPLRCSTSHPPRRTPPPTTSPEQRTPPGLH